MDYAHTPDALINVLKTVRDALGESGSQQVITVMGCGGDRDKTKRAPMGAAAARWSDLVIATSDNPRSEDPQAILTDIQPGLDSVDKPYTMMVDRRAAIFDAVLNAQPGAVVLIAEPGIGVAVRDLAIRALTRDGTATPVASRSLQTTVQVSDLHEGGISHFLGPTISVRTKGATWDSESITLSLVVDERDSDSAAPDDSFPVLLLRELAAEHLGCIPEEIPTDLHDLFDAFVAAADALDSWYAAATDPTASARRDPRHLARHLARPRRKHGHRMDHARNTAAQTAKAAVASSVDRGPRPPGQLRRFDLPHLSQWQMRWAPKVYAVFDPDGTVLRDESLCELSRPGVGAQE